jgi:hypothetical protein
MVVMAEMPLSAAQLLAAVAEEAAAQVLTPVAHCMELAEAAELVDLAAAVGVTAAALIILVRIPPT